MSVISSSDLDDLSNCILIAVLVNSFINSSILSLFLADTSK